MFNCAGGVGYRDDNFVEYDMDAEDDAWLAAINGDQDRLPPPRFELMIWRLETANALAIDRTFAAAGMSGGGCTFLDKNPHRNGDQDRLPPPRFEFMNWRLETANALAIPHCRRRR